jgi:hypothetical protein
VGYLLLALATASYAGGIVAQTVAAKRCELRAGLDVGLLARLARDRVYLLGFGLQCVGFTLAFFARADMPLYLVQAGISSAVGLAALIGATLLGWRVRPLEIGVLIVMACGLMLLIGAAQPGPARDLPNAVALGLSAALVLVLVLAALARLVRGPRGAVVLGVLAGMEFAILAIVSRPLAAKPIAVMILEPTAWVVALAALAGQWLLAAALQRGTTTATAASMDSTTTLVTSGFGLLVLGDLIAPGRSAWLLSGLVFVVAGVVAMAFVTDRRPESSEATPAACRKDSAHLRTLAQENR